MKAFHHALLIGNCPGLSAPLLKAQAQKADYILAADGGVNAALAAGITPDAVIGDLDSAAKTARQKLKNTSWIFVDNQNNTDLEKALNHLVKAACTSCTLVGFVGGRVDFSLGNLLALSRYAKKIQLCVAGDGWQIFPLVSRRRFTARAGARVSLIPLTACQGVTLRGLKFPLTKVLLPLGTTRTLSNQAARTHFTVSLTRGTLLVYVED